MDGYQVRWIQEGSTWKTILDYIQPTVVALSKFLGAELTRERGDAPELDVQWYRDDIGRAIQILIAGSHGVYELRISGSAWKDLDSPRRRSWKTETLTTMAVPPEPRGLNLDNLGCALRDGAVKVSGWTEMDLTNSDDLPPRPPNVTSSTVRGRYIP